MTIPNQESEIILEAIEKDNEGPIIELYKNGFDINSKFSDGESLLHKCFARQKYNLTQHLILLGCDFNAVDLNHRTPLYYGCQSGFFEGCQLLILLGVDLNIRDHKSRTPLMHAIKFNKMLLVKLLLSKGADSDVEDNNGFSSLLWSMKFLTSKQLKEMLSENSNMNNKIQTQLQNADEKNLKISSDIKLTLEQDENTNQNTVAKNIEDTDLQEAIEPESVSYLKDLFSKSKNKIIQAASYSIKEHLENLRLNKKNSEEFEYERKIKDDNQNSKKENTLYESSSAIEALPNSTNNQDNLKTPHASQETPSSHNHKEKIEQNKIISSPQSNNPDDQEETISRRTPILQNENSKNNLVSQKTSAPISTGSVKSENNSILPVNKNQNPLENKQKVESDIIKRPEINIKIIDQNIASKPSSTKSPIEDISKNSQYQEDIQSTNLKKEISNQKYKKEINPTESKQIEDLLFSEDITTEIIDSVGKSEIKNDAKLNSQEDLKIQNTKLVTSTKDKDETQELESEEVLDNDKQSNREIIKTQKNIKYLRDGFSEVYKDKLGQIKHEDKNIEADILGVLKSKDRVIKQELGNIKTVNKVVESDKEVKEIDPATNRIEREEYLSNRDAPTPIRTSRPELDLSQIKKSSNPTVPIRPEIKVKSQELPTRPTTSPANKTESELSYDRSSSNKSDSSIESTSDQKSNHKPTADINTSQPDTVTNKDIQKTENSIKSDEVTVSPQTKLPPKLSPEEEKIYKSIVDVNQKNSKGQSLCWLAAEKGQVNLLKKIIHDGADYEVKDPKGVSCLMIAAVNGHIDVIEYLAQKVRSVDEKNSDGNTALILAVEHDKANIARLLIDNGANIETKVKGNNLLMHASQIGAIESMKLFIMLGLDPMEKNFRGKTALDLAKTSKNKKAAIILAKLLEGRAKSIKR